MFIDALGKRRAIRLGKINIKAAKSFHSQIERLIASKLTGTPIDPQSAQWLSELPQSIHDKLVLHGLADPRSRPEGHTLGSMLDEYFELMDVKESTRTRYAQTKRLLIEYFSEQRHLDGITPHDGDKWRAWLVEKSYAEAKISKEVQIARMFFRQAVRWELIRSNPFESVRTGSQINPAEKTYIPVEMTHKLIEAAPDADWRCIIALSRYGGLRCPSEVLAVRWEDVDWDLCRLRVRSKKTEHHEGKGERLIPISPELHAVLLEAFENAPPRTPRVVNRYPEGTQNLGTHFARIIRHAGLVPWPKLFNAMRASRSIEIISEFPSAVCTAWMGHTKAIAENHYHMVRPEDFDRVTRNPLPLQSGAECGALVAQNAAQQQAATNCNKQPTGAQIEKGPAFMPIPSEYCGSLQNESMGRGGLEPPTPAFSMQCSTN